MLKENKIIKTLLFIESGHELLLIGDSNEIEANLLNLERDYDDNNSKRWIYKTNKDSLKKCGAKLLFDYKENDQKHFFAYYYELDLRIA